MEKNFLTKTSFFLVCENWVAWRAPTIIIRNPVGLGMVQNRGLGLMEKSITPMKGNFTGLEMVIVDAIKFLVGVLVEVEGSI